MQTYYQNYYRINKVKRKLESNQYYTNLREATLKALGQKCIRCGFNDWRALQIDHINGNGKKDRESFDNNKLFLKNVLQDFVNEGNKYQLLCANCNWIKRHENNENAKKHLKK